MIWARLAEVIQCIHIIYTSEYIFIISIYSRFLFKLSFTIDCKHISVSCSLEVNIKWTTTKIFRVCEEKTMALD